MLFRIARAATAVVAVGSAFIVVASAPAGAAAKTVSTSCIADLVNDDGSTGQPVPPGDPFPLDTTLADITAPAEVNAGATFDGISDTISVPVPATVDTKVPQVGNNGVVPVIEAKNLKLAIEISGAASIGTPTMSGGNVIGATVQKTSSTEALITLPGNKTASQAPAGDAYFSGGSSFQSPKITIPITAGAAGSTITAKLSHFESDALADVFNNPNLLLPTRAFCDPDANTLGTVQVVTPPPPGAPDAVADTAKTGEGKSVTVDVLANDTPNAQLPIDTSSVAVTSAPSHGTAVVNDDHTITYTPASGFHGTDSFQYHVCSKEPEVAAAAPCDIATVDRSGSQDDDAGNDADNGNERRFDRDDGRE